MTVVTSILWSDKKTNKRNFKVICIYYLFILIKKRNTLCLQNSSEIITVQGQRTQPRSQAFSLLPSFSVGRKTLVAAGHVTTCDTNVSTAVESTNNFRRSQLKPKRGERRLVAILNHILASTLLNSSVVL